MHGFWGIDSLYQMIFFTINMYKKREGVCIRVVSHLSMSELSWKNPYQVRGCKELMSGWQLGLGSQHFLVRKLITNSR